eukprot:4981951-Prymnesium_polylepis.2
MDTDGLTRTAPAHAQTKERVARKLPWRYRCRRVRVRRRGIGWVRRLHPYNPHTHVRLHTYTALQVLHDGTAPGDEPGPEGRNLQ